MSRNSIPSIVAKRTPARRRDTARDRFFVRRTTTPAAHEFIHGSWGGSLRLLGLAMVLLAATAPKARAEFLLGADLSSLKVVETTGATFRDFDSPVDGVDLFASHGWNLMRLRVFVNPSGLDGQLNTLAYTGLLAQRAKAAGMKVYIDFHLSDTWADAEHQAKPGIWAKDTFKTSPSLPGDVHDYIRDSLTTLSTKYGVMPEYIQIGNEINAGVLWPEGKIAADDDTHWSNLATLINAGYKGADDAATALKQPRPLVVLHSKFQGGEALFDRLATAKDNDGNPAQFDMIGFGYYPDKNTDLSDLKTTLTALAKWDKPILVAEVQWPYNTASPAEKPAFPQTPQGQVDFIHAAMDAVRAVPKGLGAGVCYWEPAWGRNNVTAINQGYNCLVDSGEYTTQPAIGQAALPLFIANEIYPAYNPVKDASFERDKFGLPPAKWTVTGSAAVSIGKGFAHTGTYFMSFQRSAAYAVSVKQRVAGLAPGTYTLTAWIRRTLGQRFCYMTVRGDDFQRLDIPVTAKWKKVKIPGIKVSKGACTISFDTNAHKYEWWDIDDVVLKKD